MKQHHTAKSKARLDKNTLALLPGAVVSRYIKCGKSTCRCQNGALHGPYFYRMWRVRGRLRCTYVRKRDVEAVRAACAAWHAQEQEARKTRRQIEALYMEEFREMRAQIRALYEEYGWKG